MENLVDGAIAPEGVELRALHDYGKLRQQTYDGVREAVIESFPQSYNGYRMEVSDVDYEGPENATYEEQKKAILQNKFLARKLRGTVRLVDEKTGELLDEQRLSLMRVPMITDRGSTIHGGNEYYSIMQERLLPGIYTRRQENGGLETQVNPRPTTGRDMRIGFDPETQQYRLKVQTSDLHLYSLLKDLGHDDDDLRKRWGDELFEANSGKYDARVFEKAFQKLVPPRMRKDKPEYSREEKVQLIREAFDRVEVNRRVAERNMPGMFNRKVAAQWAAAHLGRVMAHRDMIKVAAALDFLPDIAPRTVCGDLWWQHGVSYGEIDTLTAGPELLKVALAEGFDPDLDSDEMKEPYEAMYAGVGPRLAGMKAWPETYYSPDSDQMGWISWYRKFCDGTRSDDDERQINRWKRFKVREGSKFKKNPTARLGYSLRNWAIDPLKLLDKPEDRERLAEEMLDYKARETEKYLAKKAGFSVPELRSIAQFLNREHGAGLDVSQPAPALEEDLLAYIMGAGVDSGMLQAGIEGADRAYKEVMEMSKSANEGNPIRQMQLAKHYSDRKQYGAKQAILYGLMKDRPGEFFVDSDDGDIVGITHRPSNFRIHTKKMAVPAEVLTQPYTEAGSFTHEGKEYDMEKVLRASAASPVEELSVEDLKWVLEADPSWKENPDRVAKADLTTPGLYFPDKQGRPTVVDGLHRLAKAVQSGEAKMKLRKAAIPEVKPRPSEEFEKAAQAWDLFKETWDSLRKNASTEDFQAALNRSSIPGDILFYVGGDRVEISVGDWHDESEASAAEALAHQYFNVADVEDESGRPGWATECLTKKADEDDTWPGYSEDYSDPEVEIDPVINHLEYQLAAGEISEEEALRRFRYVMYGERPVVSSGEGVPQDEILKYAKETEMSDVRRWIKARKAARLLTQEPKSEAQAEAGNYPKGKFFMRGLEFTIENRKGSTRRGWKPDGSIAWESHMYSDYGYVRKTESERDGDHIDVFIGDDLESDVVYVVDQIDQRTGKFDEHKCMVGYSSMPEARESYLKCFEKGWKCGKITAITFDQFRDWCFHGDTRKEMSKTRFLIKAAKVEKVIAVDLDGTLAKTVPGKFQADVIGKPVPKMLARVRRWLREGRKVVIFTARAADKRNIPYVENWLVENDLPELEITNEKIPSMVRFYDDRAERVLKDTGEIKGS